MAQDERGQDERGGRASRSGCGRQRSPAVTLLRIWLLLTAALLVAFLLWAFAPLLVFLALLATALGIVAALMIALARALRAWRDGDARRPTAESSKEARPRDHRP